MKKITRTTALLAVMLGGAIALSGCAPTTPEGIAEATAGSLMAAVADADADKVTNLYCDQPDIYPEKLEKGELTFSRDESIPTASNETGGYGWTDGYHVAYNVKGWPTGSPNERPILVHVRVTGEGSPCVMQVTDYGL